MFRSCSLGHAGGVLRIQRPGYSARIPVTRCFQRDYTSNSKQHWHDSRSYSSEACSPKVKVLFVPFHLLLVQQSSYGPLFECSKSLRTNQHLNVQGQTQVWPLATYEYHLLGLFSLFPFLLVGSPPLLQWPRQVPKLGVLYHIKPYFGGYIPLHSPY